MPFPFVYLYFNIIAYLGSVQAGPLRNTKTECLFCGFIIKEYKINSHGFYKRDED